MSDNKSKLEKLLEILRETFGDSDEVEVGTTTVLHGYTLVRTCFACPEQYDVYKKNEDGVEEQVAYLRLRHGRFRADCPDSNGTTVYTSSDMKGDGIFDDDEREYFLNAAIEKVKEFYDKK